MGIPTKPKPDPDAPRSKQLHFPKMPHVSLGYFAAAIMVLAAQIGVNVPGDLTASIRFAAFLVVAGLAYWLGMRDGRSALARELLDGS